MGTPKQKGKSGAATNYITRNQALKKLQVTLADFRRLCILKGIYPREPRSRKKANNGSTAPATFYYTKDIQYLLHEPVLKKFRENKIFLKKLSKALGKGQISIAKGLEERKPVYRLDHIIKERYPTFTDALRDIDDALCMLFLFATFPRTDKIQISTVSNCQRLSAEFQHYVIQTRSLRKVFLSIKGIYYQAEIKGQTVTWIVPYLFSQRVPDDVDFRVMLTFLEFYQTLLGFVLYKLYTDENLKYPPIMEIDKDESAAGLDALLIERTRIEEKVEERMKDKTIGDNEEIIENGQNNENEQKLESEERLKTLPEKLQTIQNDDTPSLPPTLPSEVEEDFSDPTSSTPQITYLSLSNSLSSLATFQNIFSSLKFYLSREVPRYSLEFMIKSFGGEVGWDSSVGAGSTFDERDETITHQVVDRPNVEEKYENRVYIQPQWVYDCVNARRLLKVGLYRVGRRLPPHLSPFVESKEGDYLPTIVQEVESEEEEEEEEEIEQAEEEGEETEEESSSLEEDELTHQKELEAEAAGISYSASSSKSKSIAGTKRPREDVNSEAKELAKIMMSKRHKKLYDKIQDTKKK
ncbi:8907_t:CDS:2 [Paraglomus brasilianum]|uniref:Pescadillo homolog n=1 Tax=Paraglomus brasilianum TaxID=144538 RepID=A0A9N9FCL5_9GLOM|nr:8907_t:CDS:2 [Paraglomus brasilianum]